MQGLYTNVNYDNADIVELPTDSSKSLYSGSSEEGCE